MMSSRKLVLLAGGGILLIGAVAVVAILLATPGDRSVSRAAPEPSSGDANPVNAPMAPLPSLAQRPESPPPPLIVAPPPPRPAEGTWEAVSPVARPAAAGPVGAAIGRELNEMQPKISACFDEDRQARHGRDAVSRTQDYAPMGDYGTTVLMLQVEVRPGEAVIVDAPVETQGHASDGLVACVQRVLRGHAVRTPAATEAGRHRILFTLLQ